MTRVVCPCCKGNPRGLPVYDQERLQAEYAKVGIDPNNPNPDGSDYHLMDKIDEQLVQWKACGHCQGEGTIPAEVEE